MSGVSIAQADISMRMENKKMLYRWVTKIIESEKKSVGRISIVLCSDDYLLEMNKKFLSHNYYTDIITFDYTEGKTISGELYISVDRVKENAPKFKESFQNELYQVMAHGILHLCGYNDKTEAEVKQMRRKENQKLKLIEE